MCVCVCQPQVTVKGTDVVTRLVQRNVAYRFWCGSLNVRSRLGNMSQWEDNIKMNPHEIERGLVLT